MNIEGAAEDPPEAQNSLTRVVVTNVDISFVNMVGLLVKFALAAIPAAIIIAIIVALLAGVLRGFMT